MNVGWKGNRVVMKTLFLALTANVWQISDLG